MSKEYSSKNLKTLKFPENVQKRPTMYLGQLEETGVTHLLRESVDNAIDEFLAGHAKNIDIEISTADKGEHYILVRDDGRGIPIDDAKKFSSLFCELHSGGKFDNDSYSNSSGLNGVGLSITNAMSDVTFLTVKKNGYEYTAQFELGLEVIPLKRGKKLKNLKETGTEIYFSPNLKLFQLDSIKDLNYQYILDYLQQMAFLNAGLSINFNFNGTIKKFHYKDGLKAYIKHLAGKKALMMETNFNYSGKEPNKSFQVELNWLESRDDDETVTAFCNSILNMDGGTHVQGFRTGLTSAVKKYIKDNNIITKKDDIDIEDVSGEDIRESVIAIIDLKHNEPLFSSQIKSNLTNKDVTKFVSQIVADGINTSFNTDPAKAKMLCKRFVENAKIRKFSKLAKDRIIKKQTASIASTKLSDCTSKNPKERELFILEGNSAAGSAKMARDIKVQAIYPLRGKILNVHDLHLNKILQNKELSDLISILGIGVGESKEIDNLRYYKVIILTDVDFDGYHIASLILTFFFKYFPDLISNGNVYIANPPLYLIKYNSVRHFAKDDKEKDKIVKSLKGTPMITRFKGLGEMNADELKDTAMSQKTRNLTLVNLDDFDESTSIFKDLMGKNADPRKEFILENAEMGVVDI